jgi:hypothetical protein
MLLWCQCDKWGWDPYAGSSFFVTFQVSEGPEARSGETRRLQEFLTDAQLESLRESQNAVIRKLVPRLTVT